jgi:hypothetical protein
MAYALNTLFHGSKIRLIIVILLTFLVVFALSVSLRGLFSKRSNMMVEEEVRRATDAVGKLMELPAEVPTVATVSDVTKLPPNQPFFADAKNGDTVLFFNEAKKAILYRSDTKKIINVAPINATPIETQKTFE